MIELTKDTLQFEKQYSPHYRTIVLFNKLKLTFRKKRSRSRDFLHWEYSGWPGQLDLNIRITHHGRLTWYTIKKTLEQQLNYQESRLRRAIIKGMFE